MMATVRDACERALTGEWQETREIAEKVERPCKTAYRCLSSLERFGVCEREPCKVGTRWRLKA